MQAMAAQLGGNVEASEHREFGYAEITPLDSELLADLDDSGTGDQSLDEPWRSR